MSTNTQYHRSIMRNAGAFTLIQQKLSLAVNVYQGELVGSTEIQVAPNHKDLTSICLHAHHSLELLDVNINGFPTSVNRRDGYIQNIPGINSFAKTVEAGKDYEGMRVVREALKAKKQEKKKKSTSSSNSSTSASISSVKEEPKPDDKVPDETKPDELKVEEVQVKLEDGAMVDSVDQLNESASKDVEVVVDSNIEPTDLPAENMNDAIDPVTPNVTTTVTDVSDGYPPPPAFNGPEPGYNPAHSIADANFRYAFHTAEETNVPRPPSVATIVCPSMQYNLAVPPPAFNINTMNYSSYPLHSVRQLNLHSMIQTEHADLAQHGQIELVFPPAVRSLLRFDAGQTTGAALMHELPVLTIRIVYRLTQSNAGVTFNLPTTPLSTLEQMTEDYPLHRNTVREALGDLLLQQSEITTDTLKQCLIRLSHLPLPQTLLDRCLSLLTAQVNVIPMMSTSSSLTNSPYFWMPCLSSETHRGLLSVSVQAPSEFTVLTLGERTVVKSKTSKKKDTETQLLQDLTRIPGMETSLGWLAKHSNQLQTTKFDVSLPLSMQQLGLVIAPLTQTVPPIVGGKTAAITLHYISPSQYTAFARSFVEQSALSLMFVFAFRALEQVVLGLNAENPREILTWLRNVNIPFPKEAPAVPMHKMSPLQLPYHLRHHHDITYAAYVHHTLDDSKLVAQLVQQSFAASTKQLHIALVPGLAREYISNVQQLCIRPEVICGPQHVEQTLYIKGVVAQGVIESLILGDLLIKQEELWVIKGIVSRLLYLYIQIALGHNEAEYRLLASRSGSCRQYDLINKPGPEFARFDQDRGKTKKRGRGRKRGKTKVDLHDTVDEPAEAFTESTQVARTAVRENDACPLEWVSGGSRDQSYIDTAVDFHLTSLSMPNSPITAITNDTSSFLKAVEMPEQYASSTMALLDVLISINPSNIVSSTRYNLSTGAPEELHPFLRPVVPCAQNLQQIVDAVATNNIEALLEAASLSPSTIPLAPAVSANFKGMLDFCMKTSHTFFSSRTHVLPRYSLKFAVPLSGSAPVDLVNMDITGMASGVTEALITNDFGYQMKAESVFNALHPHFGDASFNAMWNRLLQYHSVSSLTPNRDMRYLSDSIFRVYFEQSNMVDAFMAQYVQSDALPMLFVFSRYDAKDKKMYVYSYQIQKYAYVRRQPPPPKLAKVTAELVSTVKAPFGVQRTWYDLTELFTYEDLRAKLTAAAALKFHGNIVVSLYESDLQPVVQQKLTTDAVSSTSLDCQVVSRKPKKNKRDAPRNNVDVIDSNIRGLLADEHHRWIRPVILYLHVSHILFALKSKFLSDQFAGVHATRRLDLSLHDPVYRHELECNEQGKKQLVQLYQHNAANAADQEDGVDMATETVISDVSYGLRETILQTGNFWRVRSAAVSSLLEVDREERALHPLTELFMQSLEFRPASLTWNSTEMPEDQGFWVRILTTFNASIKQILGAVSLENYALEDLLGYTYKIPATDEIGPFCGQLNVCGLGSDSNTTWLVNYIVQKCFLRYTYHITVPYTLLKRLSKYAGDVESNQCSEFIQALQEQVQVSGNSLNVVHSIKVESRQRQQTLRASMQLPTWVPKPGIGVNKTNFHPDLYVDSVSDSGGSLRAPTLISEHAVENLVLKQALWALSFVTNNSGNTPTYIISLFLRLLVGAHTELLSEYTAKGVFLPTDLQGEVHDEAALRSAIVNSGVQANGAWIARICECFGNIIVEETALLASVGAVLRRLNLLDRKLHSFHGMVATATTQAMFQLSCKYPVFTLYAAPVPLLSLTSSVQFTKTRVLAFQCLVAKWLEVSVETMTNALPSGIKHSRYEHSRKYKPSCGSGYSQLLPEPAENPKPKHNLFNRQIFATNPGNGNLVLSVNGNLAPWQHIAELLDRYHSHSGSPLHFRDAYWNHLVPGHRDNVNYPSETNILLAGESSSKDYIVVDVEAMRTNFPNTYDYDSTCMYSTSSLDGCVGTGVLEKPVTEQVLTLPSPAVFIFTEIIRIIAAEQDPGMRNMFVNALATMATSTHCVSSELVTWLRFGYTSFLTLVATNVYSSLLAGPSSFGLARPVPERDHVLLVGQGRKGIQALLPIALTLISSQCACAEAVANVGIPLQDLTAERLFAINQADHAQQFQYLTAVPHYSLVLSFQASELQRAHDEQGASGIEYLNFLIAFFQKLYKLFFRQYEISLKLLNTNQRAHSDKVYTDIIGIPPTKRQRPFTVHVFIQKDDSTPSDFVMPSPSPGMGVFEGPIDLQLVLEGLRDRSSSHILTREEMNVRLAEEAARQPTPEVKQKSAPTKITIGGAAKPLLDSAKGTVLCFAHQDTQNTLQAWCRAHDCKFLWQSGMWRSLQENTAVMHALWALLHSTLPASYFLHNNRTLHALSAFFADNNRASGTTLKENYYNLKNDTVGITQEQLLQIAPIVPPPPLHLSKSVTNTGASGSTATMLHYEPGNWVERNTLARVQDDELFCAAVKRIYRVMYGSSRPNCAPLPLPNPLVRRLLAASTKSRKKISKRVAQESTVVELQTEDVCARDLLGLPRPVWALFGSCSRFLLMKPGKGDEEGAEIDDVPSLPTLSTCGAQAAFYMRSLPFFDFVGVAAEAEFTVRREFTLEAKSWLKGRIVETDLEPFLSKQLPVSSSDLGSAVRTEANLAMKLLLQTRRQHSFEKDSTLKLNVKAQQDAYFAYEEENSVYEVFDVGKKK